MAFCTDSNWTIDMYEDGPLPTSPPTYLDTLFFELNISGGTISGDVFKGATKISTVEGTCQDDAASNAATMRLKFTWGSVVIIMGAVVHVQGVFNRLKGRFVAFDSASPVSLEIKRLALLAPDVGDTGTGNGTQT